MVARNKMMRTFLWFLLLACMLVLAKFILFKQSPQYYGNYFAHQYNRHVIQAGIKNANLKPFSTIRLFYNARSLRAEYKYKNLGGNIVGFIPLGILLPLVFAWCGSLLRTTLVLFGISLFFETVQLITGIGIFDIDDLILNTAGGALGFIMVYLSWKMILASNSASEKTMSV